MQTESALGAHKGSLARGPSGLRRIVSRHAQYRAHGREFPRVGEKALPGRVLAAFKAAAPSLGYGGRVVHAVDWLFSFTQPQDWTTGNRPVVWPSAALQQQALGLGTTQAKTLNRHLVELGLVTMKDSPNGKRYGKRDLKAGSSKPTASTSPPLPPGLRSSRRLPRAHGKSGSRCASFAGGRRSPAVALTRCLRQPPSLALLAPNGDSLEPRRGPLRTP